MVSEFARSRSGKSSTSQVSADVSLLPPLVKSKLFFKTSIIATAVVASIGSVQASTIIADGGQWDAGAGRKYTLTIKGVNGTTVRMYESGNNASSVQTLEIGVGGTEFDKIKKDAADAKKAATAAQTTANNAATAAAAADTKAGAAQTAANNAATAAAAADQKAV
ncbi:hypothetical protein, partial [Ursidibacter sp. B-7004-1]